ncbi:MAG: CpaF family protein [Nitrospinota bacterium]
MSESTKTLSEESGFMSRLGGKKEKAPPEAKAKQEKPAAAAAPPAGEAAQGGAGSVPASLRQRWEDLKEELHGELLGRLNFDEVEGLEEHELADRLRPSIHQFVAESIPSEFTESASRMVNELMDELLGLGPLESVLRNDSISEIMVNGCQQVYIEQKGKIVLSEVKFRDEAHLRRIIDRIVTRVGRRVDESTPMVDARLHDGSRVNAIIPPLALDGSSLTIRRFPKSALKPEDLIRYGSVTPDMITFLRACVGGAANVVVSGGTGSGKTTLLNMLSGFIAADERIVTIEDSAELRLQQEHVVRLETRPPNVEGKGSVSMRDLLKNALRMRPDRVIVGECRSGEALDMLQAMNTGHDGSLTTLHANTPRDAVSRLGVMVAMAGMDLPEKAIRSQIASAVHIIVQAARLMDGSRRVTHITEITGMEGETVTMQDIYVFEGHSDTPGGKIIGQHRVTGIRPKVADKLLAHGQTLPNFGTANEGDKAKEQQKKPGWGD